MTGIHALRKEIQYLEKKEKSLERALDATRGSLKLYRQRLVDLKYPVKAGEVVSAPGGKFLVWQVRKSRDPERRPPVYAQLLVRDKPVGRPKLLHHWERHEESI